MTLPTPRLGCRALAPAILLLALLGCDGDQHSADPTAPPPSATQAAPIASQPMAAAAIPPAVVQANNAAVAWMGKFDFDQAAAAFAALAQSHPDLADVHVNLATATLNRQQPGDAEAAMAILDDVLKREPQHARARYCKALLLLNGGKTREALDLFSDVAAREPADAYAAYYVGQCHFALGNVAEARAAYERSLKIDPLIRSTYYGLFQCLQRLKEPVEAKQFLEQFRKLQDNPQARLVEFKYTRMGPKGEVVTVGAEPAPPPPTGPLFADPTPLPLMGAASVHWTRPEAGTPPRVAITAAPIDGDPKLDLFIAGALSADGPLHNAVLLQRDNGFDLDLQHPLAAVADVNAALWGDFDNDGLPDVYLARRGPGQLWRQTAPGRWQDVTQPTGTAGGEVDTIGGAMFDADHDGDLDLLLVHQDGPTELLNNNLDGTFRAIGQQSGLAGDGRASTGAVVADLDGDRLADVLVLKEQPPHEVFLNDRLWSYRRPSGWDALGNSMISAAVAADANADGKVELYTASADKLLRWKADEQGTWTATPLAIADAGSARMHLAVADLTGAGVLDLIHTAGGGWSQSALDIGTAPRPAPARSPQPLLAWALVTLEPAAGPAVVALPSGGPPLIWQPGVGRYPFIALSLSGKHNKADQIRSNASGIGVVIAARVGARWTASSTYPGTDSGRGQSLQPLSFGLGGSPRADFVNLLWPDGLRQTETNLPSGQLVRIEEVQRQTSSCPVLFAWDGARYAFVTDCLGVGGIGFAAGPPGEYAPPRPWENLLLPAGLPQPRHGRIVLKLGEPMEEACYLDSAALAAYDLPPGWSMTLDERMGINYPQPTGEPQFYQREALPARAENDRGEDVTGEVTRTDGLAAQPGRVDPRFIGLCTEHSVTLSFETPINDGTGELLLIADGWIEYPYSQTTFAAWQAGLAYRAPTLEAWEPSPDGSGGGRWIVVLEQFGYPAGMPRQMSVPLPRAKLPQGTTRLRLRTNQEIYWDRLAVAWAKPCPEARITRLRPQKAEVAEVGFALRTTGPQRRPHYDYDRRVPLWDARHQDGFYTAFGDAGPLVAAADSATAAIGPGEEVHLEFVAPTAPVDEGWTRRYVLELSGWCKDRDLYTKDGQTLNPMPARERAAPEEIKRRDAMHERHNTRFRAGG